MDSRNEILTMDVKKTEDEIQTRLGSYDINTDSEISAIVQISEDEYDIYSCKFKWLISWVKYVS